MQLMSHISIRCEKFNPSVSKSQSLKRKKKRKKVLKAAQSFFKLAINFSKIYFMFLINSKSMKISCFHTLANL